jgi:1-deoxy-D-xylulose-5-phosphate synthase
VSEHSGPVAVRYPKGGENPYLREQLALCETVTTELRVRGNTVKPCGAAVITYGRIASEAFRLRELFEDAGTGCKVVVLNRIHPVDTASVAALIPGECGRIIFIEEAVRRGGVSESLAAALSEAGVSAGKRVSIHAVGDSYVPQGSAEELVKLCGLDAESIWAGGGIGKYNCKCIIEV